MRGARSFRPESRSSGRSSSRIHFVQPIKERIVRERGYSLALEGASAAALVTSMRAK